MNYPKVSIIILNWNGLEDTIECLESLKGITYPNHEVVVVDNGSEANDVEVYGFTKEFGKSAAHKYGLIKEEGIYICSKPNQEVKYSASSGINCVKSEFNANR